MTTVDNAECSTLTFANCNNCTDVSPVTGKAVCNSCAAGYALSDDASSCTSMYSYAYTIYSYVHCVS